MKDFLGGLLILFPQRWLHCPITKNISGQNIPDQRRICQHGSRNHAKKIGAEIGIFNIQKQNSNLLGDLDSSIIKTWIRSNGQLVSGYLKGSDLLSLLDKNSGLDKSSKLAFAGINANKLINGLPVVTNEYYRIATTSAISENLTKYPTFNSLEKKSLLFFRTR